MFENLNVEASLTDDKNFNNIEFEICCRIQKKANNISRYSSNDFMNCIYLFIPKKLMLKLYLLILCLNFNVLQLMIFLLKFLSNVIQLIIIVLQYDSFVIQFIHYQII